MSHIPVSHPWHRLSVRGVLNLAILLISFSTTSAGILHRGIVVNARSGAPISGAILRTVPGSQMVLSGLNGEFEIAAADSSPFVVQIRHVGFEAVDRRVTTSDTSDPVIRIQLTEAVYPVDAVVSTATRELVAADDIPFSIAAVSASELRMHTSEDLGELLDAVPGVLLQGYGGLGDIQTLSIRGSTASQVLILLDGHRLNTAQSGEIDLSTLPLESVRRVEIVRGGASAQYGADAMGGVVNIITGTDNGPSSSRISAGTTLGSFGTHGARIGAAFGFSGFTTALSYKYLRSANDFSFTGADGREALRRNADLLAHVFTARVETQVNDAGGHLLFDGEYLHQESGDPGSLSFPLARARKLTRNALGSLTVEQPFGSHLGSLQVYAQVLRFGYTDPDSYIPTASDNKNIAAGIELGDNIVASERMSMALGYSYRADRYDGNALGGDHTRGTQGAYLQGDIKPFGFGESVPLSLSVVPAVRWDHSSDFGSAVSPKLGIAISTGSSLRATAKGNFGTSFRAPTFNDLYWPFDGFTIGNPSLSPERSTDYDAGILLALKGDVGLHAGLTYYRNDVRDLILWQPDVNGLWSPSNVGRASIHGFETELWIGPILDAVRFGWTMTTIAASDLTDDPSVYGKTLPYRPSVTNKLALRLKLDYLAMTVDLIGMSRRFTNTLNTASLAPVHTMDVGVAYHWSIGPGALRLQGTLKNLENVQYQLIDGYPLPGREVRVMIEYGVGGAE